MKNTKHRKDILNQLKSSIIKYEENIVKIENAMKISYINNYIINQNIQNNEYRKK